jgi:hypothetical protein
LGAGWLRACCQKLNDLRSHLQRLVDGSTGGFRSSCPRHIGAGLSDGAGSQQSNDLGAYLQRLVQ